MSALRPRDVDSEAPELSRTRSLAPLAAAGTLFLLGIAGIMGGLPFTRGLVDEGPAARSPGAPIPLVRVIAPVVEDNSGPLLFPISHLLPTWLVALPQPQVPEEPVEVLAASTGGSNSVQTIPATPTPEPTATPTEEPTATIEPTATPVETVAPTATPEANFIPQPADEEKKKEGPVVVIVSPNPQPTPPGPVRNDPTPPAGQD